MFMYNCNWMFTGIWWSQLCYVQNKTHTNLDLWLNPKLFGHFFFISWLQNPHGNLRMFMNFLASFMTEEILILLILNCTVQQPVYWCTSKMDMSGLYILGNMLYDYPIKSIHTMCWRNMKDLYSTNSFEDCNNILGW